MHPKETALKNKMGIEPGCFTLQAGILPMHHKYTVKILGVKVSLAALPWIRLVQGAVEVLKYCQVGIASRQLNTTVTSLETEL